MMGRGLLMVSGDNSNERTAQNLSEFVDGRAAMAESPDTCPATPDDSHLGEEWPTAVIGEVAAEVADQ